MYDDSDYTYKVYKYIRNLDFRYDSFENNDNDYFNILSFKINVLWGLFTIRERDNFLMLITN